MYLPWTLPALLFSQTPLNLRPSLLNSYALLDIPTPDPPAPHGYEAIPDSHANTLQDAWYKFDAQLAADDWTSNGDQNGVKMFYRDNDETGLSIMKGIGFIEGVKTHDILSTLDSMAMRKIWDPMFALGVTLSKFSPETLSFYTATKPPGWLVSARDVVGISDTSRVNATYARTIAVSIEDDRAPPQSGKVRADLHFSGWELTEADGGVYVTTITSIDLAGSIPNWLARSALTETPQSIARIRDAISTKGVAPYLKSVPKSVIQVTKLSDDLRSWTLSILAAGGDTFEILWDPKMFPDGVKTRVDNEGWADVDTSVEEGVVTVEIGDAGNGKRAVVTIEAP